MKELISNLKFTWNYVKHVKKSFIELIISNIFYIVISIVVPILSAKEIIYLTDNLFYQLMYIAIIIYLVENFRNIIHFYMQTCTQRIFRETLIRLQNDLGKSILKLENKILDDKGTGVFIQRLTNDTGRISEAFNIIAQNLTFIITDIGIFGAIFIINKLVFVYLLLMVILLYIVENTRVKKRNEMDKITRKESEKVTGFTGEIVRGARDIKMLNAENSFLKTLYSKVLDLNQAKYKMGKINRNYYFLGGSLRDLMDLLLIILLIYLIKNNNLAVASAIIIYNYSNRISSIINYLANLMDFTKDFNLSANRIKDIMLDKEFKKEKFGKKHLDKVEGNFEFKNVDFDYNDKKKVLNNLSFKVNANETVAFVGKSGAGKSTIFSLLCKMYDVDNGTITIDGININELDKDSIRGNITIISQNPYIFNLSIKENLKLVKDNLTDEEMIEACKLACLDDFINELPDKYDTIIGEGGVNLSGGQKQRLAIARALVQKTEIILFDEATSALDNETQSKIQEAINNLQGEYTILIIAHRLSTVINSDKIFVIDDGKVIDSGTHKELLKNSEFYKNLYKKDLEDI